MHNLCKFVISEFINDTKLKGNLLVCRSLSSWHASTPYTTMSSFRLCDLNTDEDEGSCV